MVPVKRSLGRALIVGAALTLGACSSFDTDRASRPSDPDAADPQKPRYGYKVGRPYRIRGKRYTPGEDFSYDRTGVASWYGRKFHGRKTANGEIYDMNKMTAAHLTLPLPSLVEVTNLKNGRKVQLRINDRGPFAHSRIIDVSRRAAERLGFRRAGTARVRVRVVRNESLRMKYVGLAAMGRPVPPEYLAQRPKPEPRPAAAAKPKAPPPSQIAVRPASPVPGPAAAAPSATIVDRAARPVQPLAPSARANVMSVALPPPTGEPRRGDPARGTRSPRSRPAAPGVAAGAPGPGGTTRRDATGTPGVGAKAGAPVNLVPESWSAKAADVAARIPNSNPNLTADTRLSAPVPPPRAPSLVNRGGKRKNGNTPVAAVKRSPGASERLTIYVQAGAYSHKYNADRVRRELSRIGPVRVTVGRFNKVPFYRVRVGPVRNRSEGARLLAKVVRRGYPDARIIVAD